MSNEAATENFLDKFDGHEFLGSATWLLEVRHARIAHDHKSRWHAFLPAGISEAVLKSSVLTVDYFETRNTVAFPR